MVSRGETADLLLNIPPGHMKLIADSTPIATPSGYRRHGDIRAGDFVFGPDGMPTRVRAVSSKALADHEVEFSNGETIKCNGDHLWTVFDRWARQWKTLDTTTLAGMAVERGRNRFFIPDTHSLRFDAKELPLHPYFLGCWLGDGTSTKPCITHDVRDDAHIEKLGALGYRVETVSDGSGFSQRSCFTRQGVVERLRDLDLFDNKHIPDAYVTASEDQRLELLAGLVDTDGHVDRRRGRVRISTCDTRLAGQIERLVFSLGFRAYTMVTDAPGYGAYTSDKRVYQIGFQVDRPIPTATPRKQIDRFDWARRKRAIVAVRKSTTPEIGHCLSVDRPDGLYVVGRTNVVTHNSLLLCVFWPAWEWTWNPFRRFLFSSYSDNLSERDSRKCRRLIESEWFQERWGHKVSLSLDQNEKDSFENTATGTRAIASIGGAGTGFGANHLACDDPHNAVKIHSLLARQGVQDWWRDVWSSRMRPPGSGGRVVIMQRLHTDDLSAYLIKRGFRHICLPFEYEPDHPNRCRKDWRREPGDILWPEMFTPEKAQKLKDDMETDFVRAGQLQQRPVPRGGGILKVHWWRIWPDRKPPATDFRLLSIDTAYTEKEANDCSAATLWGRFRDQETRQPQALLMYAWCDRLEQPELVDHLHDLIRRFRPMTILIENKANGISVQQELQRRVKERQIIVFDPKRYGDKINRAYACQGIFSPGKDTVIKANGHAVPGKAPVDRLGVVWALDRAWAGPVIEDCGGFPAIRIKDRVDTVTQALIWMRRNGYIMPPDEVDQRYLDKLRPKPPPKPLYAVD